MEKIGIICESFKLRKFEEELKRADISYEIVSNQNGVIGIACYTEQDTLKPIVDYVTKYFVNPVPITSEEILELMHTRQLTVEKVINTIVDANAIIGVGLVTLGETLHVYTILNKELRRAGITEEEIDQIITNYKRKQHDNRN